MNSSMAIVESWFIPIDICLIICCILILIITTCCLLIIILDKRHHTIPMILIGNSYLCAIVAGCGLLSISIFTFKNDLKHVEFEDSYCVFRGYIIYVGGGLANYSYLLQTLYRYLIVIYPTRLIFQSYRFQFINICIMWIFSWIFPFVFLFTGEITYDVDNQVCQLPVRFSFSIIYMLFCMFSIPILSIMFIYWKLIRYVRKMGRNVTGGNRNTLIRVQRELKMIRRTVILVTVLIGICFPFTIFMFMGYFNQAPKYHYRISFIFVHISGLFSVITLFLFTDSLKETIINKIKCRINQIIPT